MHHSAQTNLFDLLPAPGPVMPSAERIRKRLHALLATARAAELMPWSAQEAEVNATIFPQMATWLPEAERDTLRAEFAAELERLRADG
ncbi:MAG: hypothetical protein ABI369_08580 [Acetobacteraceae bacterium]